MSYSSCCHLRSSEWLSWLNLIISLSLSKIWFWSFFIVDSWSVMTERMDSTVLELSITSFLYSSNTTSCCLSLSVSEGLELSLWFVSERSFFSFLIVSLREEYSLTRSSSCFFFELRSYLYSFVRAVFSLVFFRSYDSFHFQRSVSLIERTNQFWALHNCCLSFLLSSVSLSITLSRSHFDGWDLSQYSLIRFPIGGVRLTELTEIVD